MPQQREDVFGTRYNGYTQKFHSRQEMFAAGVRDSDSEWEAAGKIQAKQRNDESLKRQQEANQMLFEKYGSSGLNLSQKTTTKKGAVHYTLQFIGLVFPGLNFIFYPFMLYFIFSNIKEVKPENRKRLFWYAVAMVTPFALIVLPSLSTNKNDLFVPFPFFLLLNVVIAMNAMLFNYLCEQLREKK